VTRRMYSLIVMLVVLLVPASLAMACPMCKDSIADTAAAAQSQYGAGGPQTALPSGFNVSIYYMLGGLFCTLGLVVGVITKGIRDSNASMHKRGFEAVQRTPADTHPGR
jgi:hypothetical protein